MSRFTARPLTGVALCFLVSVLVAAVSLDGADWPTYRFDEKRSGATLERLDFPLTATWVHRSLFPPEPAWPDPARQNYLGGLYNLQPRCVDDRAYRTVIAAGLLYFGSSSDDKLYCLDATTGRELWSFFADGPIRYAPVVSRGRLYFGSDDGWIYCLEARRGRLVWKYSPREDHRLLANDGKLISRVPVRTGLVVKDDIVYACNGHFPLEGTYQTALDAADGAVLWQTTRGVAAQGYLLAGPDHLVVPTGRASPEIFDRATGAFLRKTSTRAGGTFALLTDDLLITGPGAT